MKKILVLAMVLSVLGSIVGCGSSDTAATDTATTGTTAAPATTAGGDAMKSE